LILLCSLFNIQYCKILQPDFDVRCWYYTYLLGSSFIIWSYCNYVCYLTHVAIFLIDKWPLSVSVFFFYSNSFLYNKHWQRFEPIFYSSIWLIQQAIITYNCNISCLSVVSHFNRFLCSLTCVTTFLNCAIYSVIIVLQLNVAPVLEAICLQSRKGQY